jgi:hypothetical protein
MVFDRGGAERFVRRRANVDACVFHFYFQWICEVRAEAATITTKLRYNNRQ